MDTLKPSPARANKHDFYITFPDGTKIEGFSVAQTICLAIQKIGVEKAAKFALRTDINRKGYPYISKQNYNISGNYPYVKVDGYYVIKTISADNWKPYLEAMSADLGLGIKVHYIKKK